MRDSDLRIINKKGLHNYQIIQAMETGIKLIGSEVKSIRDGRVELGESFAKVLNGEIYLINAHIPAYQNAPIKGYEPTRTRKLLLHKSQIQNLIGSLSKPGLTLVPISIYQKNNLIKVELGLAKSKSSIDKRKEIKKRDDERRMQQELRGKE